MTNSEKVKKGLECCSNCSGDDCSKCPYQNEAKGQAPTCTAHLSNDALELLKEQDNAYRYLLKQFVELQDKLNAKPDECRNMTERGQKILNGKRERALSALTDNYREIKLNLITLTKEEAETLSEWIKELLEEKRAD